MGERIGVRNPRTGQQDYWITPPERDALADLCARLRRRQVDWWKGGLERRIEVLQQWREALLIERDRLVAALATDTGRRVESDIEVDLVIGGLHRWTREAPTLLATGEEQPTSLPFVRVRGELVPYPLVGVISPWNFPLLLSLIDVIPALLAGCAVIVKPSEVTPRFIEPLSRSIEAVPPLGDVLAVIPGTGETGATLIELVDAICFTGSVETGRKVAAAAARHFIPAFLELGGKDPAIVLASANLELATAAILWGSIANVGQSCLSIERIYVARSVFSEFVDRLVARAKRIRLAYPSFEDGELGPLIDEQQARIIQAHLQDAVEKGARIHCGGRVEELGGGLWCRPTVLTDVDHSMKVMTEETFGPIMPVMAFDTVDEAISLANGTIYGLSAAVFAGSTDEALAVGQRIQAGGISINDAGLTAIVHEGEKNAFKLSGLGGSRMGPAAIRRFVRRKSFLIKTNDQPDPWWYDVIFRRE
ncbi:MAG: aldehyde dehydrogenase family protein [Acidobacteria bacterium]|nr:MAG: aldehyde dehydrogenase family protein [Acidobacteriota bacterium]